MYFLAVCIVLCIALATAPTKTTFTCTMYFRQSWSDPRLRFDPKEIGGTVVTKLVLSPYDVHRIWEPDTFLVNEVRSFLHQVVVPNEFVRISSDGTVLKSQRYTVTSSCHMDFQLFPFDTNFCTIEIESFGYTMADVRYTWHKGLDSVGISSDMSLPAYRITGHRLKTVEISLTTGNYSRLAVQINLWRSRGKFISRYFFPLIIFVSISLLSLWASSEKMGTLINFLNVGFIHFFMAADDPDLPTISYTTAFDLYCNICSVHVILCLLDSLVAMYFEVRPNPNLVMEMTPHRRLNDVGGITDDVETLVGPEPTMVPPPRGGDRWKWKLSRGFGLVNVFVKIGLAVSFLVCNLIYFEIYSNVRPDISPDFVVLGDMPVD